MSGKGSKRRKENYTSYVENYDNIDWSRRPDDTKPRRPKLTFTQMKELMEIVRKTTIKKDGVDVN